MNNKPDIVNGERLLEIFAHSVQGKQDDEWHLLEKEEEMEVVPQQLIESKILFVRGKKVMLDRDLALLYGVETKALNQAVKRNLARFPEDFMFQLSKVERNEPVTNCDWFKTLKHSTVTPY